MDHRAIDPFLHTRTMLHLHNHEHAEPRRCSSRPKSLHTTLLAHRIALPARKPASNASDLTHGCTVPWTNSWSEFADLSLARRQLIVRLQRHVG